MKIGTIIKNNWAGKESSTRYFIYTGIQGQFATGIHLAGNKLEKAHYYKGDFQKDKIDGVKAFEEVGYCEAFKIMKRDLRDLLEVEK